MNDDTLPEGITTAPTDLRKKFDLQLSKALTDERKLAEIFAYAVIEKIELKSETHQWEKTGNICIEFINDGQKSGIAVTEADFWVHELKRDNETLCYLMFPIERLRQLCVASKKNGGVRHNAGDDGKSSVVPIKLKDILK
jgi:hypothetical protein